MTEDTQNGKYTSKEIIDKFLCKELDDIKQTLKDMQQKQTEMGEKLSSLTTRVVITTSVIAFAATVILNFIINRVIK